MLSTPQAQSLAAYAAFIPEDRRQAIARGLSLPEYAQGAALFADISGFTPLTEALARHYGPHRGAEELTGHLEHIYHALIEHAHAYGGSVIGFSGDAITGWFDADDGRRALAAGLGMRTAIDGLEALEIAPGETVTLAIKVAVAAGRARRLLVGDPAIQVVDVLGGEVAERLASLADALQPGQVAVDALTAERLQGLIRPAAPPPSPAGTAQPLAVAGLTDAPAPVAANDSPAPALSVDDCRPWILPALFERLQAGHTQFLTELRPAVALFLRFGDLDYAGDPAAGHQLDAYIRWVQSVLARLEGVLLQITLGEKGSYLYAAFGAPASHEDDPRRAVLAALELRAPPAALALAQPPQIGISRGTLRTGPSGSPDRRCYAVMGDEANIAARLMQAAAPGEIIITQRVMRALGDAFEIEALPPLKLKGKAELLPVYRLAGALAQAGRLQRAPAGETVGRAAERAQLDARLEALRLGQGGAFILEGEAGIGKSRLLADWLAGAQPPMRVLFGAAEAVEQAAPYYAWRSVMRALLAWDTAAAGPAALSQQQALLTRLESLGLADRAPLLNAVLPLDLPENQATADLTGKVRADNLHAVVVALLRQAAAAQPLLLALEDAHWLDSASWALALTALRQVQPLLLVVATRALPEPVPPEYQALLARPGTGRLVLQPLPLDVALLLVCRRLGVASLPEPVAALIRRKAEGHPFFSEELAYALRDSGVITIEHGECRLARGVDIDQLNLPDTVEGVVTSRLDSLTPGQQVTAKVASVIGRVFAYQVLEPVHPVEAERPQLPSHLAVLARLDITPLASPAPNLSYGFKHIITQEAAYNLLLFAQRRQLHQAVAEWHERAYAADLSPHYPLLAHHWLNAAELTQDSPATQRAVTYLDHAGTAALRADANQEALGYFTRLLGFVKPAGQPGPSASHLRLARWQQQLGEAHNRLGRLVESERHFAASLRGLDLPLPGGAGPLVAGLFKQLFRQARQRLRPARPALSEAALDARRLACQIYERLGLLYFLQNNTALTVYCPLASLNLAEEIGPSPELAIAYSYVTGAAGLMPVHGLARLYERLALSTAEQVGKPLIEARVLMAVSVYSAGVGRLEATARRLEQAIGAFETAGSWEWWGVCTEMLIRLTFFQGRLQDAAALAEKLYARARQREDVVQQSWSLSDLLEIEALRSDGSAVLERAAELKQLVAASRELGPSQKLMGAAALVHLRRGEGDLAQASAAALLDQIARERPTSFGLLTVYAAAAESFLALWERGAAGDPAALQRQAVRACKVLAGFAQILPVGRPAALRAKGLLAWLKGRPQRALPLWAQSCAQAEALHMPLELARSHLELGRHLPAAAPERVQHLQQAETLLRQMGVSYYDAPLQAALSASRAA